MLNNFNKKNITVRVIIIILANIMILASCSTSTINETGQFGNSVSNILNGGLAVKQDGWIYAILMDGLYKINSDGTSKEKITEDMPSYINVWDGWIYYSNDYPGNGEIYKIASDGSQRKKINNERSYNIIIKEGWIYYSTLKFKDEEIEFKIKKMKMDGTNPFVIVSEVGIEDENINPSDYFYLTDRWIYYKSMLDNNNIYKIKNDGSDKTKVSDENFSNKLSNSIFVVDENWIYYIHNNKENKLYRMKTDGTEKELVINKPVGVINITNEYIFYTDESDDDKPYRRNKDGSSEIKLADFGVLDLNIIDDWIYCSDIYRELKFYKIRSDGTSSSAEIENGLN